MFREMRLAKQAMDKTEIESILSNATNGVLSLIGDNDYPYGVPLSYVYINNTIYFHCTKETSHKMDAINNHDKVSFCVVSQDNVIPSDFNTLYKSVIVFGKAKILEDKQDIFEAMMEISKKYSFEYLEKAKQMAQHGMDRYAIVAIHIEYMSGKSGC